MSLNKLSLQNHRNGKVLVHIKFKKAIQSIFYNLLVVSRFLTISHAFLEKKNTNLTIFNQARLACLS